MSLKYQATKVEEGHYVLPKIGQMKVEAHAFLSDALYEASEVGMWDQLANGASYESIIGAYAMLAYFMNAYELEAPAHAAEKPLLV